ncbi:XRE family transcriptional regulator [Nocardiopsis dassonvillei]|uniref:XRE family transcriptional regulator n=1 Tax=Nocardiopsis dassonvillei TaxID=2014 RepID=UPI00366A65CD
MNAALRKALAASRLTEIDVAAHLGVDPKTVRRWLSGQRPYPRHRWALADLLQTEEDTLWPPSSRENETPAFEHVQRVYAHRWQVPREVWYELFAEAEEEIGILVYSGLFLADDAGILQLLGERARKGVNVRILLGDPESQTVRLRGKEEGIGEVLSARVNNSLLLFRALIEIEGIEVRIHSTTLYNSIYFTENRALINQHIYGIPAARCPVIEVARNNLLSANEAYIHSFEITWNGAKEVDR